MVVRERVGEGVQEPGEVRDLPRTGQGEDGVEGQVRPVRRAVAGEGDAGDVPVAAGGGYHVLEFREGVCPAVEDDNRRSVVRPVDPVRLRDRLVDDDKPVRAIVRRLGRRRFGVVRNRSRGGVKHDAVFEALQSELHRQSFVQQCSAVRPRVQAEARRPSTSLRRAAALRYSAELTRRLISRSSSLDTPS